MPTSSASSTPPLNNGWSVNMADKKFIYRIAGKHDDSAARQGMSVMDRLRKKVDGLSQHGGKFGKVFGGALKGLLSPMGIAAAGALSLAQALRKSSQYLQEWGQQEEVAKGLAQALKNAGTYSDQYFQTLQNLANEKQKLTAIGSEDWIEALTRLTQTGADATNIKDYATAVENLAGIKGVDDITTATRLFSRAMQGQYDHLVRYGLQVETTGDHLRDLNNLMDRAARMGGGQLQERARGITGQVKSMSHAWGGARQAMGRFISRSRIGQAIISGLTKAANGLEQAAGGTLIESVDGAAESVDNLVQAASSAAEKIDKVTSAAGQSKDSMEAAAKAAEDYQTALAGLTDATLQRDLAKIDLAVAKGDITAAQGAYQKAGLQRAYESRSLSGQLGSVRDEIASGERTVSDKKAIAAAAAAAAAAALKKYNDLKDQTGGRSMDQAGAELRQIERERARLVRLGVRRGANPLADQAYAELDARERQSRTSIARINQRERAGREYIEAQERSDAAVLDYRSSAQTARQRRSVLDVQEEEIRTRIGALDIQGSAEALQNRRDPTRGELLGYLSGAAQPAAMINGVMTGGDVGERTRQAARHAIGQAAKDIIGGGEDEKVVTELIAKLQEMGAVVRGGYSKLSAALDRLDNEIDLTKQQIKSGRE
jgi:hypothetical protein